MLVLGLDFETTGLDIEKSGIVSVAGAVIDADTKRITRAFTTIVKPHPECVWTKEAIDTHGITPEFVGEHGMPEEDALDMLERVFSVGLDAFCAHNATTFDKLIYDQWLKRTGRSNSKLPWIDSVKDLPVKKGGTLTHMGADLGLFSTLPAHDALNDVQMMLAILAKYDIREIVKTASAPVVRLEAYPKGYDPALNVKFKAAAFRWDPDNKGWFKDVRDFQVEAEQAAAKAAGFRAVIWK
jgi:DNA polymerase III alpha subunit (gram-positive type)